MRMGKALRSNKEWSTAGGKPLFIPSQMTIGQVSLDLTMSYAWPRIEDIANEALANYSKEWLLYEDELRQVNIEIGPDGSTSFDTSTSSIPVEPPRPLFDSQFKIDELESSFQDVSDHFFAKKSPSWKVHANAARFERMLDERYGVLRPFITNHPEIEHFIKSIQRKYAMGYFSPFRSGRPPISRTTSVVLLFMMHRGGVRWEVLTLATLFLLIGLQPWALVAILCLVQYLFHRRRHQPIGTMKRPNAAQTIKPYYQREEKETKVRKNEYLLRGVGAPLAKNESIDTSLYDTILIGTGHGTLYAGALLSRAGRRVLVLSKTNDASGCATLQDFSDNDALAKRWRNVPFDVNGTNVSKISGQQRMLAPALVTETDLQGGIRFAKIGSDADGHAHCILSIPGMGAEKPTQQIPFVLRSNGGVATLMDDAAVLLGDNYDTSDSLVGQYFAAMSKINQSSPLFYLSKVLPDAVNKLRSENDYQDAALRECEALLNSCFPVNPHLRSLMAGIGMRGENLVPANTSTSAHVSNICAVLTEEGIHYPIGGPRALCHALASTIEQCGGRVVTQVPVTSLVFDETLNVPPPTSMPKTDPKEPNAPCCVGVGLGSGKTIMRFPSERYTDDVPPVVVSMEGLIHTFIRLVPNEVREIYKVPRGIPALTERRPLLHFLFGLQGSATDLDISGADYIRLPNAALPRDEVDSESGEIHQGQIGWSDEPRPKRSSNDKEDEVPGEEVAQPKRKRPITFDKGKSWMRISFPSAKDPSFEQRHGNITACVVTIEADDNFVRRFDTKPVIFLNQQQHNANNDQVNRLTALVKADLLDIYPQLDGRIEFTRIQGPDAVGLSHTPERYVAKGVRADCPYPCLFVGGSDLVLGDSFSAETVGSWLVANAVMGYNAIDHLLLQKNITSDLERFLETPSDQEDVAVEYQEASVEEVEE